MARDNPIQFAVVREDPEIELEVLRDLRPREAFLIASGGCTALTLAALRPDLRLTLLDANAAQLDLIRRKVAALEAHGPGTAERARLFGVHGDDPTSLSGCGNFESLFRGFRALLDDLVLPATERERLLRDARPATALIKHRYWPATFAMFFSDALLEAMFGPEATQHAEPGSYPTYFRRAVERGLSRSDRSTNYFLHHLLLGHYLEGALPTFLAHRCGARFEYVHVPIAKAPDFSRFDLVHLSNLFDWMDDAGVADVCRRLSSECRPGTRILLRQLNHRSPVERLLSPAFRFDEAAAASLLTRDRSLFYERILIGAKNP